MCSVPISNPHWLGGNLCFIHVKLDFRPATFLFNMAKGILQVTRRHGFKHTLIASDVLQAVAEGRTPLVLSERKLHLELLRDRIESHVDTCAILIGGMGKKRTAQALESLERSQRSVLLATGKLIGEGFDDPRLDTLFLTFPVSWKGIVHQYVGRLHRRHTGKDEARVYDYVDSHVPVLAASFRRRIKSYERMGYVVHDR